MATLGTFDSFTTARLGIYAAQHGLRVTGNNISNINTAGYTRQRLEQVSVQWGDLLPAECGDGAGGAVGHPKQPAPFDPGL